MALKKKFILFWVNTTFFNFPYTRYRPWYDLVHNVSLLLKSVTRLVILRIACFYQIFTITCQGKRLQDKILINVHFRKIQTYNLKDTNIFFCIFE